MKVFLQAIVGQILFNLYLFYRGKQALPPQKKWRVPFVLFFLIEWTTYFYGFFFHKDLPDHVMIPILYFCGTWYVASIYLMLGLLAADLLRLTNRIRPWIPASITARSLRLKRFYYVFLLVITAGLMVRGYYHVTHPVVTYQDIHIPKEVEGRDSLTIALISDTHFGEMIGKKSAERFVALCNAQQPDIIIINGDIMDYESRFAERAHIEDDLRKLHAPLGVYITLGNHEYRANRFAKLRWLQKTGGVLLVDSVVMPDSTFYLVGRDDATNKGRKPLSRLLDGVDKRKPVIVADHQPRFNEIVMNRCDLGLHGHTHNGQFWPYSWIIKLVYRCSYGYYKEGGSQFYISSGIGFAGPPYRIGTKSELAMIRVTFHRN